jgi:hypothetical protein
MTLHKALKSTMSVVIIPETLSALYQREVDAVISGLGTDARRGLSEAEARDRLVRFGATS